MAGSRAYGAVGFAVVSVSFASLFFRWAESPPLVKAFYRLALAAIILAPFVLVGPTARRALRSLGARDLLLLTLTGLVLALHFGTWVTSLSLTSVASSTLLVTAHPLVVGLASHFYLRESLHRWIVLGIVLGLAGALVIALGDYGSPGAADSLTGDLLALAGGVFAAIYLLAGRRMRQRLDVLPYALTVYGAAALFLLLFTLVLGAGPIPEAPSHGLSVEILLFVALAVISSIGGHTLYNWALRYLPATIISTSLLGEPLGASLLALTFLGEVPRVNVFAGAPLILAGVYLATRPSSFLAKGPAPRAKEKTEDKLPPSGS